MASPGNRHCANCIGALSFPMFLLVPAHPAVPDKRSLNGCVCVFVYLYS